MTAKPVDGASAIPAEAFADAHRRLLADGAIQFELPREQPAEMPQGWADFIAAVYPVLQVLFWALLATGLLYILFLLVRWATGWEPDWPWRRRAGETVAESWRPGEAPARQLLVEADALAAAGRFSEAARLLLLRSIEDIDARRPAVVRPALTSRDIAALPAIPGPPRSAFASIAMMVERSLFAARPLAEGDWQACRAAYEDFAFAEGWRG